MPIARFTSGQTLYADNDPSGYQTLNGVVDAVNGLGIPITASVSYYGARGDGVHDDTAAIQAALTAGAGKIVFFPPGVYLISATLLVSTGTRILGAGSSTILRASSAWPACPGTLSSDQNPGNRFFQNLHFQTSVSLSDSDIIISDLCCDYGSYITGTCHAMAFRYASRIQVLNCRFINGANATAFLACDDVLTQGCTATGQQNACYDHWEGCTNIRVIGNFAKLSSVSGTGIQVSGLGTNAADYTSSDIAITGNIVVGNANGQAGITLNALGAGSAVRGGAITGNRLYRASIVLDGPGSDHIISGNTLTGAEGVIWLRNAQGTLTNCVVTGNTISGAQVVAGNVGPVHLEGSGHVFTGNRITGGSWNVGVWIPANNCVVLGNLIDTVTKPAGGNSGPYQSDGTGNLILSPNVGAGNWEIVRGTFSTPDFYAGGSSSLTSDSSGNLTVPQVKLLGGASPIQITAGAGAPTGSTGGANVSGSIRIRTDGVSGSRLYISQGAGTWTAVSGV